MSRLVTGLALLAMLAAACSPEAPPAVQMPDTSDELTYTDGQERYSIAVPPGWEVSETDSSFSAHPADADTPRIDVAVEPLGGMELDVAVEQIVVDTQPTATVEPAEVPGAVAARRATFETDEDLGIAGLLVQRGDDQLLSVTFAYDTGDHPDQGLIDQTLDSFEIHPPDAGPTTGT